MPRISPSFNWSETPRSAATGPKVLTTFWARSASGAPFMRRLRPSCPSAAADPGHMDIEQHGGEDRRPQDDVEGKGVDADQGEAVAEHAQHDGADQPADDGAG